MTPDLQERITGILDWLEKAVTTSSAFVADQTPLVVQEILRWNFAKSLIFFIITIIVFSSVAIGFYKHVRYALKKYEEDKWNNDGYILSLFFWLFSFPLVFLFALPNLDWIQILLAPRLYLIEYLKDFL